METAARAAPDEKTKAVIRDYAAEARTLAEATLEKVSHQLGSNEGGWFENTETGERLYVKFYQNPDQARAEFVANALYEKLGIPAPRSTVFEMNGRVAVASREIPGAEGTDAAAQRASPDVRSGFVVDAYLANWDVVGLVHDNIVRGADGRMHRVDNGGSLTFRAMGGPKDFSPDDIPELKNMLNPAYAAGRVFNGLTEAEMRAQAEHLVNALTPENIDEIIAASGLTGKQADAIRSGLKGRLAVLRTRFLREPEVPTERGLDAVFASPRVKSHTALEYAMPEADGRELAADHRLQFTVPKEFRGRIIRDVILRHRKAEKYRKDIGVDRFDPHGAYSRVEVHDVSTGQWVGWRDPKGYSTDKFAEARASGDPENEALHDWIATVGEIRPDALRLTNVGKDEWSTSQIHGLEIVFFPELEGVHYRERIYCSGTSFIDLDKGRKLPTYGGGSHTEGRYEGAMALNHSRSALYELGKDPGPGAKREASRLVVDLEPGKTLAQAEISVGDTEHLAQVSAKTGRRTRLGYSKLWVGIKRAGRDQVDWFIENANIPPQGVIAGGPEPEAGVIQPGDKLIVEARQDAAYLMGWRVAYKKTT